MVVCVIILLLITAGFPEYDAVYFDSPGPNAAFTVPENSPSYDVATFDLVGTTPSAIIKKQEPTNPEFELVLVRFSYILRAPALDFEAERTYTVTIEASDSDDGSTDTQTHTVTVTDINEKPKFTQTTFHATIESRDLYQVVVDINPTDEDTEPPNSAANCTIEDGNGNGFFQIEYSTCLISTDTLLGDGQTLTLTIGLADQGTPPLTADQNAVVTIEVIEPATTTTTTTTPTTTTTTTTPTSIGASSVSDQAFQDNITPEKNREISEAISNLFWVCAGIVIVAIASVNGIFIVKSIKGGKKADEHKQTRQIPASHQYPL